MKIYRVRTFSESEQRVEGLINLPGWRNSNTGFWTSNLNSAINIWQDRNEACFLYSGGGTWARIIETDISNVVTADDPSKYKSSHDARYDDGEIFVVAIKDETKIKKLERDFLTKRKGEKEKNEREN